MLFFDFMKQLLSINVFSSAYSFFLTKKNILFLKYIVREMVSHV